MLRPRIIPVLLVRDQGLVKTKRFSSDKYVGDPINAVRIFNEKEVDEILVLDIDATRQNREPDYNLIEKLANECQMPLCYGGGVKSIEQTRNIISLGVEKVALSTAAVVDPAIVTRCAEHVGSQSIVAVLDVRRSRWKKRYDVYLENGTKKVGASATEIAVNLVEAGAGEVVFNSIDHDGMMQGYDMDLVEMTKSLVRVPVSYLGGAGTLSDISELVQSVGLVGAAAGSLFVFKGRYRAVLINYPNPEEKESLLSRSMPTSSHNELEQTR